MTIFPEAAVEALSIILQMVLILFAVTVKAIAVYFHKDKKALKFPKSGSEQVSKVKENLINNSDEFSFN